MISSKPFKFQAATMILIGHDKSSIEETPKMPKQDHKYLVAYCRRKRGLGSSLTVTATTILLCFIHAVQSGSLFSNIPTYGMPLRQTLPSSSTLNYRRPSKHLCVYFNRNWTRMEHSMIHKSL